MAQAARAIGRGAETATAFMSASLPLNEWRDTPVLANRAQCAERAPTAAIVVAAAHGLG